MQLIGQTALVTGASRGIGRAVALALAREGAAVVVGYREQAEAALAVVANIEGAGGQALPWQVDVADVDACRTMVEAAATRFGRLDILVNNAGHGLEKLLLDTGADEWDRLMAVHLRGMYALTRAALPHMMRRRYGRVINVSSIWGISGAAGEVAYSTAKAGQIGFTRALAREVGQMGITVNAVAPGAIDTDMNAGLTGADLADWLERTPVGRLGTADEVAGVVCYLAGPGAGFITGQVWSPNGGVVI
ncbi:MAG TPA: 3-oxoacyl-ACP reductase family protein [Symbiobacteriaceae bacterium]|nr:3-oxoacyl-ACP reductase family protein [Symbiobacteriaceae bacterium]